MFLFFVILFVRHTLHTIVENRLDILEKRLRIRLLNKYGE